MQSDFYPSLVVTRASGLVEITLNRPHVRNALDETLISDITRCVNEAAASGTVRAIVLRGTGSSFCAGADLNWMARAVNFTYEETLEDALALRRLLIGLAEFPGVTIAAVHGAAVGGGAGLAAACDIAIAGPDAWFMFSEVRLGLVPAIIAPFVVDKIGTGAARALFLSAERVDGDRARQLGLATHFAVTTDEFEADVRKAIDGALSAGPHAVQETKRLLREIADMPADRIGDATAGTIARVRAGVEGQEGARAFLEKRRPAFNAAPDNNGV